MFLLPLRYDRSQVRKLYQKATRIIPDALHKDDQELINIWLGFAQAEMYVGPFITFG